VRARSAYFAGDLEVAAGGDADPQTLFGAVLDVVPAGITRDTIE
jgi:hypothetical protein